MEDNDFKQHLLEKMNQQSKKWVRVESLAIGNIFLREMAVYYTANVFKFFVILFIGSTIFGLLTHWNVVSVFFLKFNAQTLIFFSLFFLFGSFFGVLRTMLAIIEKYKLGDYEKLKEEFKSELEKDEAERKSAEDLKDKDLISDARN